MSSHEFSEWQAYEAVCGPLGPRRADYHAAIIAAAVINAMRGKKSKAVKPESLVPWDLERPGRREQTAEEQLRAVQSLNARMGGRHNGKPPGHRDQDPDQA